MGRQEEKYKNRAGENKGIEESGRSMRRKMKREQEGEDQEGAGGSRREHNGAWGGREKEKERIT